MGILDRLFDWMERGSSSAAVSAPRQARIAQSTTRQPASRQRSLQAGTTDRLTQSWTTTDKSLNQASLVTLKTARARSRDFVTNNEYGRKFIALVRANIVGHAGFALKVDCRENGKPDPLDSARIKRAFDRWAKRGQCDVTGRLSFAAIQRLVITLVARDGEVLVRKVEGKGRGIHRFQLQVLPSHLLPEGLNRNLQGGGRIRMGVEFNAEMRPVAYYLRIDGGSADLYGPEGQRYQRVPAEEIYHLFVPEDADQWRGVPWPATPLRGARHLDQFEEAALVAANVGAGKMGFFQQKDPDAGPLGQTTDENGEVVVDGSASEFRTMVEPGTFDVIPEGYEFREYDPTYPNEVFDPFVKAVLRKLSSGMLVSYHSLSGDLTDVNYSSIRQGTLDDREQWKLLQGWMVEDFLEPVFADWLLRALMNDPDLKVLPPAKFDKFNAPLFTGRRWDWVDPQSDVTANEKAVGLGIKSRAQIIRDNGDDPEQVWAELEAEKARGFVPPGQQAQPQPAAI